MSFVDEGMNVRSSQCVDLNERVTGAPRIRAEMALALNGTWKNRSPHTLGRIELNAKEISKCLL